MGEIKMLIDSDGTLTKDEALDALRAAAEAATNSLPDAFQKCNNDDERQVVMRHRDAIVLAHLRALDKSLQYNSKPFEDLAKVLSDQAGRLGVQVSKTKEATETILLFSDLLQLAATLALAFA
ncbi:hypothetical protein [Pseudomonas fluorescens]|nr:hypothetical protein [Pseudomonas fluorescens]